MIRRAGASCVLRTSWRVQKSERDPIARPLSILRRWNRPIVTNSPECNWRVSRQPSARALARVVSCRAAVQLLSAPAREELAELIVAERRVQQVKARRGRECVERGEQQAGPLLALDRGQRVAECGFDVAGAFGFVDRPFADGLCDLPVWAERRELTFELVDGRLWGDRVLAATHVITVPTREGAGRRFLRHPVPSARRFSRSGYCRA